MKSAASPANPSAFNSAGLTPQDVHVLEQRWARWGADIETALSDLYEPEILTRIQSHIAKAFAARSVELRDRDQQRLLQPDWYQLPEMIGYAAYTDRFAGNLKGVEQRIDYLNELGVTYLHLMPLLQPRKGPNDGGYAVADYRQVRSDLGTMADLESLASELHKNGISLTLDLVLNHVADQHEWAEKARRGDAKYRDYFYIYPDRQIPDQFERTLPEIFPAFAPGNFTWDEDLNGWVWTTFNSWQWDLNWSNPDVFIELLDVILYLANKGADCLRLDAIAFIWKKLGTDCQNQPEVHQLTQALRAAAHIAAPALILKAEAIVGPNQLVQYLGQGEHAGKVSEIAYHNSLMVQIWSAFASQDARLMEVALSRFNAVPTTAAWGTYVRCHDDIGWAIDDADAAAVGWNGGDHRRFLSDFYVGDFPNSFSVGAVFQPNELTGDRRISGTLASMLGVEKAVAANDGLALDIAIARINCAYAMVYGFGGIPLLYMGDELAITNDYGFEKVAEHADDNRWLHRPQMPWNIDRTDATSAAGRVFEA
ncbi:MAG: amylosucrase, partial [Actinomycetota bacterium]